MTFAVRIIAGSLIDASVQIDAERYCLSQREGSAPRRAQVGQHRVGAVLPRVSVVRRFVGPQVAAACQHSCVVGGRLGRAGGGCGGRHGLRAERREGLGHETVGMLQSQPTSSNRRSQRERQLELCLWHAPMTTSPCLLASCHATPVPPWAPCPCREHGLLPSGTHPAQPSTPAIRWRSRCTRRTQTATGGRRPAHRCRSPRSMSRCSCLRRHHKRHSGRDADRAPTKQSTPQPHVCVAVCLPGMLSLWFVGQHGNQLHIQEQEGSSGILQCMSRPQESTMSPVCRSARTSGGGEVLRQLVGSDGEEDVIV